MSYAQMYESAKKDPKLGLGSGWFTIKDGESKKIKLVSKAVPVVSLNTMHKPKDGEDTGPKLRTQFLVYVIDRADGKVKPYGMPKSVMKQLIEHQTGEEFGFTTETPPYDLTIKRTKDGGKTSYMLTPTRNDTQITETEAAEVAQQKPIEQLAERMQKKYDAEIDAHKTDAHGDDDAGMAPPPDDDDPGLGF